MSASGCSDSAWLEPARGLESALCVPTGRLFDGDQPGQYSEKNTEDSLSSHLENPDFEH